MLISAAVICILAGVLLIVGIALRMCGRSTSARERNAGDKQSLESRGAPQFAAVCISFGMAGTENGSGLRDMRVSGASSLPGLLEEAAPLTAKKASGSIDNYSARKKLAGAADAERTPSRPFLAGSRGTCALAGYRGISTSIQNTPLSTGIMNSLNAKSLVISDEGKGILMKFLKKSIFIPSGGGMDGYAALFMSMYQYVRDRDHIAHQRFFDPAGHGATRHTVSSSNLTGNIREVLIALKKEISRHGRPGEFLKHNRANTVRALKHIMVKYCQGDEEAVESLVVARSTNDPGYREAIHCRSVQDIFREIYIPSVDEHPESCAFDFTFTDANLYAQIFKVTIFLVHFDSNCAVESLSKLPQQPLNRLDGLNKNVNTSQCDEVFLIQLGDGFIAVVD